MKLMIAVLLVISMALAAAVFLWAALLIAEWFVFTGPGTSLGNVTCHTWNAPDFSRRAWCYFPPETPSPTQPWQVYLP